MSEPKKSSLMPEPVIQRLTVFSATLSVHDLPYMLKCILKEKPDKWHLTVKCGDDEVHFDSSEYGECPALTLFPEKLLHLMPTKTPEQRLDVMVARLNAIYGTHTTDANEYSRRFNSKGAWMLCKRYLEGRDAEPLQPWEPKRGTVEVGGE